MTSLLDDEVRARHPAWMPRLSNHCGGMNTYLRLSVTGIAAGLLALITFVAGVYLALALFTLTFTLVDALAQARALGVVPEAPVWGLLAQSLVTSGENALRGLWELRGAMWAFGGLGLVSAWSYQAGLLVNPRRAGWISFLTMAALLVITALTWLYAQREQITLWMAESPETYRWRDVLFASQAASLTVGPIFAVAFAYPTWTLWRWWYLRLMGGRLEPTAAQEAMSASVGGEMGDYRRYAERLNAIKRGRVSAATSAAVVTAAPPGNLAIPRGAFVQSNRFLGLLLALALVTTLGYAAARQAQTPLALRLQHGAVFVDAATQPHAEFRMQVASDVRRLRIVNINGLGRVSLTLSLAALPTQPVSQVPRWEFQWRQDEYLYQDIPVHNLAPGDYLLQFDQAVGWGYFEYMLSQGDPQAGQTLALVAGLLLATSLLLAFAIVGLIVLRFRQRQEYV